MVYKIKQLISTAFCPSLALHFSSSVLPWLVVVCKVWSWSREVKRHSLKNELAIINELSWNSCFVLNIIWISHQEIKSNFQLENLFLCTTGTALMIWKLKKNNSISINNQPPGSYLVAVFLIFVVKQAAENLASILLKETLFKHIN